MSGIVDSNSWYLIVMSAKTEEAISEYRSNLLAWLSTEEIRYQLKNIQYTLLSGRSQFDRRSAFVVRSKEELIEKISKVQEGQRPEGYYETTDQDELSQDDKRLGDTCLSQLESARKQGGEVEKNLLNDLARMYVKGYEIDGKTFINGQGWRRVPAPSYVFAKEKYWISGDGKNAAGTNSKNTAVYQEVKGIHPLVDSNCSTFMEEAFSKTFTGEEFFLHDHRVGENKVLPGVAYLEMVRACVEEAVKGTFITEIKDVVWLEPIQLEDGVNQYEIKITLYPEEDREQTVWYTVTSQTKDGKERLHSQGTVVYGTKEENQKYKKTVDYHAVEHNCTELVRKEECYKLFASRGLNLLYAFQSISEIRKNGEHEAISRIELPANLENTKDEFFLHPSLLDGCLQTVIALVSGSSDNQSLSLPFALESMRIVEPFTKACHSHVFLSNTDDSLDKVKKFNVDIVDDAGNLLIEIKNFTLKVLGKPQEREDKICYVPEWKESNISDIQVVQKTDKKVILFDCNEELKQAMEQKGYQVILVTEGQALVKKADAHYEFDRKSKNSYVELLENVLHDHGKIGQIIFNIGISELESQKEFLDNEVGKTLKPLVFLSQACLANKDLDKVKLIYLYSDSLETKAFSQAVGAAVKTIARESSKLRFGTIGMPMQWSKEQKAAMLEKELSALNAGGFEIVYKNENRFSKEILDITNKPASQKEYVKEDGVYVITGGMGALGQIIAKHLADIKRVKLVLLGRRQENDEIREKINKLQSNGSKVTYLAVNLASREEVKSCVTDIRNKFHKIDGIIHCAGINQDAFVAEKTEQQIDEVMKPKMHGIVNLDEALGKEKLDFFVAFSSIAGVFGNPGQVDYAFANGFMDGYLLRRNVLGGEGKRFGTSISINWPFWKNGGMVIDEQTSQMFEQTIGVHALTNEDGTEFFDTCMMYGMENILVVKANKEQFADSIATMFPKDQEESTGAQNSTDILSVIQNALFETIEKLLNVNRKSIKLKVDLSEYGFNSLTFTEFANELNNKYGLNITPALFFEHSTLQTLADYLYQTCKDKFVVEEVKTQTQKVTQPREEETVVENRTVRTNVRLNRKTKQHAEEIKEDSQICYVTEVREEEKPEIAIVGISGIFPQSEDLDELWQNLVDQKNLVSEIPSDRWDWREHCINSQTKEKMNCVRWGGFMKDVRSFDPVFFGITPREAEKMDPQQRLLLETVWNAIEDAGHKPSDFSGTKTGVYMGVATSDYTEVLRDNGVEIDSYTSTGLSHCILVNRISYLLNVSGPSVPVDTACSSSLIAIHQAVQGIKNGDCDMAIAGGVNVILSPILHSSFGQAGMLSEDGSCKSFDKSANGYVRGEGVGTVLLKKLDQAKADGDHIYAVVKMTAVNHGGHVNTITTPNPNAQAEILVKAYEKANIDPATVTYIETHGTGTKLGDPIEVNALKKAFETLYRNWGKEVVPARCGLGTIKSNMGHLEAAAGIAGIMKVLLSMKNHKIPGNLNFHELNPYIQIEGSPFYIVDKTQDWDNLRDEKGNIIPKRAGISSFGFGGANAHVVLEEYIAQEKKQRSRKKEAQAIVLSAKNEATLKEYAARMVSYLKGFEQSDVKEMFQEDALKMEADILNIEKEELSMETEFQDCALDPVNFASLCDKLNRTYFIDVLDTSLEHFTALKDFSEYVYENYKSDIQLYYQQKQEAQVDLEKVAYTLQVGRESYKYRLAFSAISAAETIQKLEAYLAGKAKEADVYTGIVEEEKDTVLKNMQEYCQNRDLPAVMKLWVTGELVEWNSLYEEGCPARMTLPPYPFAKKYCWFDSFKRGKKEMNAEKKQILPQVKEIPEEAKVVIDTKESSMDLFHKDLEKNVKEYNGNEVTLEILQNEIAVVTINDYENRNMFSDNVVYGLMSKFDEINRNESLKAVVVTGSNGIFSMGGTQKQLIGIANETNKFSDVPFLYRGFLDCKIPVISAMAGHASGGGMLVGLYADIVVMSNESIYTASFMKYGFTPGMGATSILKERFGTSLSSEMMLTARAYKGSELRDRGASVLFKDKEEVLNEAISIARILCEKPRKSLMVLKRYLADKILDQLPATIEKEEVMHRETFCQSDVKAKIEKYYGKTTQKEEKKQEIHSMDDLLQAISQGKISPEDATQYHFSLN